MSGQYEAKPDRVTEIVQQAEPPTGAQIRHRVPYLVVLAGGSVGRVVRLQTNAIMKAGRARSCQISFDCDNISREHVQFEADERGNTFLTDLQSTNGTLVNGKRVDSVLLRDGDRICMGNLILRYSLKDDLEYDFHQDLYDKATKDPLTSAYNKRFFMEAFQKEFAHHNRHQKPLSLLIFDLDNFKKLNDTYGHVNGDIVLKSFAREVMSCLRHEDLFCRFGGEEFVALFRYTNRETAINIAEKLKDLIAQMKFATPGIEFQVTATIGIATMEESEFENVDDMLMKADQNLYIGKSRGKNRVIG
jgi:diguanylate cyclase (GGDEF)-like protein